jgi:hypothetical protein
MTKWIVSLLLSVLLTTPAFAIHGIPNEVVEGDIQSYRVVDNPELARLALIVEEEYNKTSGLSEKFSFPVDIMVSVISGRTAKLVSAECECAGRTAYKDRAMHGLFVILGVTNMSEYDIFAHEFTHIMQLQAGVVITLPTSLLEAEAELIRQRAMLRFTLNQK